MWFLKNQCQYIVQYEAAEHIYMPSLMLYFGSVLRKHNLEVIGGSRIYFKISETKMKYPQYFDASQT